MLSTPRNARYGHGLVTGSRRRWTTTISLAPSLSASHLSYPPLRFFRDREFSSPSRSSSASASFSPSISRTQCSPTPVKREAAITGNGNGILRSSGFSTSSRASNNENNERIDSHSNEEGIEGNGYPATAPSSPSPSPSSPPSSSSFSNIYFDDIRSNNPVDLLTHMVVSSTTNKNKATRKNGKGRMGMIGKLDSKTVEEMCLFFGDEIEKLVGKNSHGDGSNAGTTTITPATMEGEISTHRTEKLLEDFLSTTSRMHGFSGVSRWAMKSLSRGYGWFVIRVWDRISEEKMKMDERMGIEEARALEERRLVEGVAEEGEQRQEQQPQQLDGSRPKQKRNTQCHRQLWSAYLDEDLHASTFFTAAIWSYATLPSSHPLSHQNQPFSQILSKLLHQTFTLPLTSTQFYPFPYSITSKQFGLRRLGKALEVTVKDEVERERAKAFAALVWFAQLGMMGKGAIPFPSNPGSATSAAASSSISSSGPSDLNLNGMEAEMETGTGTQTPTPTETGVKIGTEIAELNWGNKMLKVLEWRMLDDEPEAEKGKWSNLLWGYYTSCSPKSEFRWMNLDNADDPGGEGKEEVVDRSARVRREFQESKKEEARLVYKFKQESADPKNITVLSKNLFLLSNHRRPTGTILTPIGGILPKGDYLSLDAIFSGWQKSTGYRAFGDGSGVLEMFLELGREHKFWGIEGIETGELGFWLWGLQGVVESGDVNRFDKFVEDMKIRAKESEEGRKVEFEEELLKGLRIITSMLSYRHPTNTTNSSESNNFNPEEAEKLVKELDEFIGRENLKKLDFSTQEPRKNLQGWLNHKLWDAFERRMVKGLLDRQLPLELIELMRKIRNTLASFNISKGKNKFAYTNILRYLFISDTDLKLTPEMKWFYSKEIEERVRKLDRRKLALELLDEMGRNGMSRDRTALIWSIPLLNPEDIPLVNRFISETPFQPRSGFSLSILKMTMERTKSFTLLERLKRIEKFLTEIHKTWKVIGEVWNFVIYSHLKSAQGKGMSIGQKSECIDGAWRTTTMVMSNLKTSDTPMDPISSLPIESNFLVDDAEQSFPPVEFYSDNFLDLLYYWSQLLPETQQDPNLLFFILKTFYTNPKTETQFFQMSFINRPSLSVPRLSKSESFYRQKGTNKADPMGLLGFFEKRFEDFGRKADLGEEVKEMMKDLQRKWASKADGNSNGFKGVKGGSPGIWHG